MDEIKRCPVCGKEVTLVYAKEAVIGEPVFVDVVHVEQPTLCSAETTHIKAKSMEQAIELWNERSGKPHAKAVEEEASEDQEEAPKPRKSKGKKS